MQLEVLDDRRADLGPARFERGHTVRWDRHLSCLDPICGGDVLGRGEDRATFLIDAHFGVLRRLGDGVNRSALVHGLYIDQNFIILIY